MKITFKLKTARNIYLSGCFVSLFLAIWTRNWTTAIWILIAAINHMGMYGMVERLAIMTGLAGGVVDLNGKILEELQDLGHDDLYRKSKEAADPLVNRLKEELPPE